MCQANFDCALAPSERACCSRGGCPHRQRRFPGKGSADVSKRGTCTSASHARLVPDGGLCDGTGGAHPCQMAAQARDSNTQKERPHRAPLATTDLSSEKGALSSVLLANHIRTTHLDDRVARHHTTTEPTGTSSLTSRCSGTDRDWRLSSHLPAHRAFPHAMPAVGPPAFASLVAWLRWRGWRLSLPNVEEQNLQGSILRAVEDAETALLATRRDLGTGMGTHHRTHHLRPSPHDKQVWSVDQGCWRPK